MTDTLRSIAEGMEHEAKTQDLHPSWKTFREIHDRLEALLAGYEKVDLVKRWRKGDESPHGRRSTNDFCT